LKIAYFDLSNGASGDMILAALIDAGAPLDFLKKQLKKLPVAGYRLKWGSVRRMQLEAKKLDVLVSLGEKHSHRGLSDIRRIISASKLSERVKKKSLAVFQKLARAEAFVHGTSPLRVKFHEVGAVDSIVDIVGAVIALDYLGVEKIYASAFSTGSGFVSVAHGRMALPAPATAKLLEGYPVRFNVRGGEMTTPTGAAIITTLADRVGGSPSFKVLVSGSGAGAYQSKELPNILRVFIGESRADFESDEVFVIETNIDDMSGEVYGVLFEELLKAGALDVYAIPVTMKKTRPAYLLSVIADEEKKPLLEEMILRETSTFGVRSYPVSRKKLGRDYKKAKTPLGTVRIKRGILNGKPVKMVPEYEDCRRLAEKHRVPFIDVYAMALKAAKF